MDEVSAWLGGYVGHDVIIEGAVIARIRGVTEDDQLELDDLGDGPPWRFDLRRMRRPLRILPLEAAPNRGYEAAPNRG